MPFSLNFSQHAVIRIVLFETRNAKRLLTKLEPVSKIMVEFRTVEALEYVIAANRNNFNDSNNINIFLISIKIFIILFIQIEY